MGLSDAFVEGITNKIGGTLTDESTDEAIEQLANQAVEIAKLSQGEATRWAQARQQQNQQQQNQQQQNQQVQQQNQQNQQSQQGEPDWFKKFREATQSYRDAQDARIKALETQNTQLLAARAKEERTALINAAFAKHNIPESLRENFAIPDTVEANGIDGHVAAIAQKLVTLRLPSMQSGLQTQNTELTSEEAKSIAAKMLPGFDKKES